MKKKQYIKRQTLPSKTMVTGSHITDPHWELYNLINRGVVLSNKSFHLNKKKDIKKIQ